MANGQQGQPEAAHELLLGPPAGVNRRTFLVGAVLATGALLGG